MGLMLLVAMCALWSVPAYGWYREHMAALEYENSFVEARRLLDLLPGGDRISLEYRSSPDDHAAWVYSTADVSLQSTIFIDPSWERDVFTTVTHEWTHVAQNRVAQSVADIEGVDYWEAKDRLGERLDDLYGAPAGEGIEYQAACYSYYVDVERATKAYIDEDQCPGENEKHLAALVQNKMPAATDISSE